MATYTAGSVGVLVTPNLSGFQKDLKKQLTGSGMEATGRQIADDIVKPLKSDTAAGAKQSHQNIENELGKTVDGPDIDTSEMEGQGTEGGSGFGVAMLGALKKAKVPIVAAVVGIGAAAAAGFAQGIESNTNTGDIMAALGLDESEARAHGKSAGAAYRDGYGEDKGEVTQTLTFATQVTSGDPNADTQRITELAETMAASFEDIDAQEAIRAVSTMINNDLVDTWEEGFDVLTYGAQNGANMAGDMLDTFSEYSPVFKNLGMTGADAMGMLIQGMRNGARDTDVLADNMKEFTVLVGEGGEDVVDTLTALGLPANQIIADINAGGPRAAAAYQQVTDALRGVEDDTKRVAYETALFGAVSENMGSPAESMNLAESSNVMSDFEGSTQNAADALTEMRSPIETLKRELSGLGPMIGGLFAPLTKGANKGIIAFFDWISNKAIPAITGTTEWQTAMAGIDETKRQFGELTDWFQREILPRLGAVWDRIKGIFGELWTDTIQPFIEDMRQAYFDVYNAIAGIFGWEEISADNPEGAITTMFDGIKGVISGIVGFIETIVVPAIGIAVDIIAGYITYIGWIFTGLATIISGVINWIVQTAIPWLQSAWEIIGLGASWLYQNIILPVWNGIWGVISAVINWILYTAVPWLQSAWTAISNAVTWLYQSVILPVWDAIRIAIAIAVGIIMSIIDGLVWVWRNVMAPVLTWLYQNVVLPVWNAIQAAISAVVNWFRDTAWPILSAVINWIRTKFEQFKVGLGIIWGFIKNNVINPVISWFQNTVWPILSMVINWIRTKFEQFKLGLQIIWNFIKNNVINPVISWFRDTAWPLISNVIGSIKSGFQGMKDRIKSIWDGIQNNVINPVVTWFETKVLDRINKFVDKVKSAFQGMKDGIGEAFEQVKGKVRGPVEWLIKDVVNGSIIDNINSVLTTFGMEDKHISPVKMPKGFATGGYTGPGSKYQPAGVVHADEFVIRKESQNSLRRAAPGFLDSLNRYGAKALHGMGYGYASGGLVTLGPAFHGSGARGDGFGARGGKHKGIDWALPSGHALIATADGTALRSSNSAAGNKLTLSHGNGIATTYHHLSGYAVASGASVKKGQVIGYVGSTGRSSGPHLHLGVQKDGNYVNPDPYLTGGGEAGSGSGGFFNPFAGLWDSLKSKVSEKVGDSVFGQMVGGMPKFIIDKGTSWFTDQLAALGDFASDAVGATRWSGVATEALVREGQFGPKRLASLLRRMGQESSYNPRAINNWDSNAAAGNSSRGLMQVIPTTFAAYRDKNLPNDIYDPLANIVASIRYTLARYGDLEKGWDRKGGYAEGGLVTPELHDSGGILKPGLNLISNKTRRPEAILTSKQWDALYQGRTESRGDLTLNQYINDAGATADRIAAGVSWELRRQKITGRR